MTEYEKYCEYSYDGGKHWEASHWAPLYGESDDDVRRWAKHLEQSKGRPLYRNVQIRKREKTITEWEMV